MVLTLEYGCGRTYLPTQTNPLEKGGKKKKKNTGINPGQPARKRREKKRGKNKNPGINPGQPAGKRREKKREKTKTLVLTLGSPPGKGGKKKKKKTLVLTLGSPPEKGEKKKPPGPDLGFRTSTFKTWTDGKKKPWSRSGFQDLDFQDLDRWEEKKNLADLGFKTSTFRT